MGSQGSPEQQDPRTKMYLDMPTVAQLTGFSRRKLRTVIKEDNIRIVQIGKKFFILGQDFVAWENSRKLKPKVKRVYKTPRPAYHKN